MRYKIVKKYIKIGLVAFFLLAITGYAYWRARDLIRGVVLQVEGIENGKTYFKPEIHLSGQVNKVKEFRINGREIFMDKNWYWNDKILLLPGYNVITLATQDNFGKKKEKVYQVIYK